MSDSVDTLVIEHQGSVAATYYRNVPDSNRRSRCVRRRLREARPDLVVVDFVVVVALSCSDQYSMKQQGNGD